MITSDDAEKAIDWFKANAGKLADAKAGRVYMTEWIKVVKAKAMQNAQQTSTAAQERDALVTPEYAMALDALREVVSEDERLRWLATAAEAQIEAWRSQESTRRAEGKAYA